MSKKKPQKKKANRHLSAGLSNKTKKDIPKGCSYAAENGGSQFDGDTHRLDVNPITTSIQYIMPATHIVNYISLKTEACNSRPYGQWY